jgi:hypothetical protein
MNMGKSNVKSFLPFPAFALCFLFLLQVFCIHEVSASSEKCADVDVEVFTEIRDDIPFVCHAAEKTFAFLTNAGLTKRVPIKVYIVEKMKERPLGNFYLGMYERRHKRIVVLSYSSCRKRCKEGECFCGLKLCRNLHSSIIVHEIAHAIAHANFHAEAHNSTAEEYIAYTTQFALLPNELRQKILTRIKNNGFGHEREITSLFHDLSPSVFAVKAYRHFLRPENGAMFYMKLISGKCKLDMDD